MESGLSTTDVSLELVVRYGIRASRDRIARLADVLFPRLESGQHRRFTPAQVEIFAAAVPLLDAGLTRHQVADIIADPQAAATLLREEAERRQSAMTEVADRLERMSA